MVHVSVSVIARTLCLLLVAGLVAGAMLGTGAKYEVAASPSLSAQVHGAAAETAEPSRLCTAGHACALLAGAAPMPPGLSAGAVQPPRSLTALPMCDDAPPVQPPRTTA
jgi:hypothetical protein